MPAARMGLSTSVLNGKIYAIGGATGVAVLNIVEEYNPITDTWTRKSDMPTVRQNFPTSVVNGKIYAIGGGTNWDIAFQEGVVEEYTPEGWQSAVSPQGKLSSKWGQMKQNK